ncbi:MFS transporter [Burkholderia stabilis]|uniref:MFS transporter n=1 Tax=Burkholderia stabilis TaxID=95485 RepID=A0AAJ5NA08_9BURK|nr:DUF2946 domain-containing protein [Burkholderia stabilis]AOR70727.1 MFS transporter [Burkholderia stabilis]VBB14737.1 Protein of unknown function (DUF2946) [Burkholderia stabilis]HDR9496100.1 DUF2946 domain-containing protein [Burkholderia stabilis]HDR9520775.1 DUF2946 domain-containing protein [Burkholderia stabilis]HDR9528526.1 DUF2946 domain-containing protein [Burkholderia stabilis]
MLSRRLRKIGSLIGMLAILMTALAPTISQALTTQGRVDALLAGYCTAAPAAAGHAADPSSKSLQAHLQACGYCSLLAHTPALPAPELTFAAHVRSIQHREATRFESLRRALPLTAAQPRAPPFAS